MTTNKDLYLQSIEHCKMFAPIAERLGIDNDGLLDVKLQCDKCKNIFTEVEYDNYCEDKDDLRCPKCDICYSYPEYYSPGFYPSSYKQIGTPTYRQDKLESVLPEWCYWSYPTEESFCTQLQELIPESDIHGDSNRLRKLLSMMGNWRSWELYGAKNKGEPKRQATVDLICLLDEESLL